VNESHPNRQSLPFYLLVFTAATILCAMPLWYYYGHDWRYGLSYFLNSFIEGEALMKFTPQPEVLPFSLRAFYTIAVASIPSALITFLIFAYRHDYCSQLRHETSRPKSRNG